VLEGLSDTPWPYLLTSPNDNKFAPVYKFLSILLISLIDGLIDHQDHRLESIVLDLQERRIFKAPLNENLSHEVHPQHEVVMLAIGWLTMCTPRKLSFSENLVSSFDGEHDLRDLRNRDISQSLLKFDLFRSAIDPPPPLYSGYGHDLSTENFLATTIRFKSLEAIGCVNLKWTDQIPLHLQFNLETRTLTLFAFPSVRNYIT